MTATELEFTERTKIELFKYLKISRKLINSSTRSTDEGSPSYLPALWLQGALSKRLKAAIAVSCL